MQQLTSYTLSLDESVNLLIVVNWRDDHAEAFIAVHCASFDENFRLSAYTLCLMIDQIFLVGFKSSEENGQTMNLSL